MSTTYLLIFAHLFYAKGIDADISREEYAGMKENSDQT